MPPKNNTPPPWQVVVEGRVPSIIDKEGNYIAEVCCPHDDIDVMMANADVMRAAPDLLAACELALADIKERMDASGNNPMECERSEGVTAALRAAIAKARHAP